MKKPVFILCICLLWVFPAVAQTLINTKGTRIAVDTSKWKPNGADIYNKNTGNIGIGLTLPLYKLDVTATANPLRLTGLQAGAATDSVLTVQSGVVRYAALSRMITDTSLYKYDGTLSSNRTLTQGGKTLTFATGGAALNITGLPGGASTDSIVTVNATGQLRNVSVSRMITDTSIYRHDGTLSSNRTLTQGGNSFTIATGGSAFNISGLTSGAVTDSLLTVNPTTGRVARMAPSQLMKSDSTTAGNGLTLSGKDVQLGGTLSKKDTIITSSTNTLALRGLQTGADTDSLLAIEANTGVIRKVRRRPVTIIKTTTTQSNSTTIAATINTLSFTAAAGNTYRVRLWLVYNSSGTGNGIRLGPNNFTGGNYWYTTQIDISTTGSQQIAGFNAVNILPGTQSRSTTGNVGVINMTVEATSTATVSFQFASENNGSTITIQANSLLEYEIIN